MKVEDLRPKDFDRALSKMIFADKMREIYNLCLNKSNKKINISGMMKKGFKHNDKLVMVYMLNTYNPHKKRKLTFIV